MRQKLLLAALLPVAITPAFAQGQPYVPAIGGPATPPYVGIPGAPLGMPAPPASAPDTHSMIPSQSTGEASSEDPHNPGSGQAFQMQPPPVINPINQAPVPLTDKESAGSAITRHWRRARSMPASGSDGAVVFTYGATQPSIVCAPLTVCLLKLEEGEHVLDHGLQLGDGARWKVSPSLTGNSQTVLVIKPTDAGLRTTLAIMTNRRVYTVRLVSVQSEARSMAVSEFSYPEETQAAWKEYYAKQEQERQDNTLPSGRNIANLDFNYSISGDDPPWRPTRVYNDGVHTYIQFPNSMRSADAPSLLTLAHDGSWFSDPTGQVVNYRKEGDTYVVDKVFDRAELIIGVGSDQTRVVISHQGA